jgi:hypothetical protein
MMTIARGSCISAARESLSAQRPRARLQPHMSAAADPKGGAIRARRAWPSCRGQAKTAQPVTSQRDDVGPKPRCSSSPRTCDGVPVRFGVVRTTCTRRPSGSDAPGTFMFSVRTWRGVRPPAPRDKWPIEFGATQVTAEAAHAGGASSLVAGPLSSGGAFRHAHAQRSMAPCPRRRGPWRRRMVPWPPAAGPLRLGLRGLGRAWPGGPSTCTPPSAPPRCCCRRVDPRSSRSKAPSSAHHHHHASLLTQQ